MTHHRLRNERWDLGSDCFVCEPTNAPPAVDAGARLDASTEGFVRG